MKILFRSVVLLLIFIAPVKGVEINYPVSDIPKKLLENADAVVRVDEGYFEILSPGRAKSTTKYVITIFNKNADDHAAFVEYYDKSDKITHLTGKIYNAFGKCIHTAGIKDFDDMSAVSGYALYGETRMKRTRPVPTSYPYTVEYDCEEITDGLLFYPPWYFISDYRVSVQYSRYTVDIPREMGLRYKQLNFDSIPEKIEMPGKTRYIWKCSNLKAFEAEPYSLPLGDRIPYIIFGANEFEMEGYSGRMDTWENLGKWQYQLLKGQDELPEQTIQAMQDLVKECNTDLEKIKKIYSYVQKKTRYVAIALGIGGWQPFPASIVDEYGYGDCKALSNYTIALLKTVGIKSYYATIRAGDKEPDIIYDFPSKQTNHIIVCVPLDKDTIWLECTNQFNPCGYMGTFTDNRHVQLIDEDGGKIVKTPSYPKDSNLFIHNSKVEISTDGHATVDQQLVYKSLFYDDVMRFLIEDADQQKRWLYSHIDIPDFIIKSFKYNQFGDRYPTAVIQQTIDLPKYSTISGNRIFIPLKMMDRVIDIPRKLNERKTDIYIRRDYIRIDTIRYRLPEGYKIEYKPDDLSIESVFGRYEAKVMQQGNEIIYIRKSESNKGIFPKNEYDNMIDYYKQMAKADKAQLVLVRQ